MPPNFDLTDEDQSDPPEADSFDSPVYYQTPPIKEAAGVAYSPAKKRKLPKFDSANFDPEAAAEAYLAPDPMEQHAKAKYYADRGFEPVTDAVGRVVPRGTKFNDNGRADLEHLVQMDDTVDNTPKTSDLMRVQRYQAQQEAANARRQASAQRKQDAINARLAIQAQKVDRDWIRQTDSIKNAAASELSDFNASRDGKSLITHKKLYPNDAETAAGDGPEAEAAQARLEQIDAASQKRERLEKKHQDAASASSALKDRLDAERQRASGIAPMAGIPKPADSTRPYVALGTADANDAPDDLVRMKNKAGELQRTLDGKDQSSIPFTANTPDGTDNLDPKVQFRLRAQIKALTNRYNDGLALSTPEDRQRIVDQTRDPTIGEDLSSIGKGAIRGTAKGVNDIVGGALNLGLLATPGGATQFLAGPTLFDDFIRKNKEAFDEDLSVNAPESVKQKLASGLSTGVLPELAGGIVPYALAPEGGAGAAVMGSLGMGQSVREEAEKQLSARRDRGEITQEQYQKGLAQATGLGGLVGVGMAVPFGNLAQKLAGVPAGRTFMDVLLTKLGSGGDKAATDWVTSPTAKKLLSGAAKASEDGLIGAATGFGQSVASNAAANGTLGNVAYDPSRGTFDGAGSNAVAMGLISALHGVLLPHNGELPPRTEDGNNPESPDGSGSPQNPDAETTAAEPSAPEVSQGDNEPATTQPVVASAEAEAGHAPEEALSAAQIEAQAEQNAAAVSSQSNEDQRTADVLDQKPNATTLASPEIVPPAENPPTATSDEATRAEVAPANQTEAVDIGDRGTAEEQAARNQTMLAEQKRLVDEHLAAQAKPTETAAPATPEPAVSFEVTNDASGKLHRFDMEPSKLAEAVGPEKAGEMLDTARERLEKRRSVFESIRTCLGGAAA